ncbi:hypothetical protein BDV12DRAFT_198639 [Aspergillus spectabilis]
MDSNQDKNPHALPPPLNTKYGIPPRTRIALGCQGRKYFDSGDFALSAVTHETDAGAITTGTDHPLREGISRPYAPVPINCNVGENANKGGEQSSSTFEGVSSPLCEGEEAWCGEAGE